MVYQLEIKDKCPSLNGVYAGLHWTRRSQLAKQKHELIEWAVYMNKELRKRKENPITKCTVEYEIHYKGNRRHDNSNAFIKIYEDGLVRSGVIKDDSCDIINEISIRSYTGQKEDKILITINEICQ
jgi:Holliday junction resolvase RusA-like endonuclease